MPLHGIEKDKWAIGLLSVNLCYIFIWCVILEYTGHARTQAQTQTHSVHLFVCKCVCLCVCVYMCRGRGVCVCVLIGY